MKLTVIRLVLADNMSGAVCATLLDIFFNTQDQEEKQLAFNGISTVYDILTLATKKHITNMANDYFKVLPESRTSDPLCDQIRILVKIHTAP